MLDRSENEKTERSIREYDGAVAVDEGAVMDVVADALGEGDAFALAAEAGEIGGGVEMGHALDFLLDDGAGVEIGDTHFIRQRAEVP